MSCNSNTLSQRSSDNSSSLEKLFTKYHRFDSSEYNNDSEYENVRESDLSDYENVRHPDDVSVELQLRYKESDDDQGTESQDSHSSEHSRDTENLDASLSEDDWVDRVEPEKKDSQRTESPCIPDSHSGKPRKCKVKSGLSDDDLHCCEDEPVDSVSSFSNDTSSSLSDDIHNTH